MARVGTSRRCRAMPSALAGLHRALEDVNKWRSADDIPEQALTVTFTAAVVVATVDLPTPPETTFSALTNAELYSRWLRVPVTIEPAIRPRWSREPRSEGDTSSCSPRISS